jgi:chromosome segregation ATPase
LVVKTSYERLNDNFVNVNKAARAQAAFDNYQQHQDEYPGFERGYSTFARLHDSARFELRAEQKERIAQGLRQANETMTTEYNEKVHTMEQELAQLRQKEDATPQIEELQAQLDTVREEYAAVMRKKDADLEAVMAEARRLKDDAAREKDQYQEEIEKAREQAKLATDYSSTL